MNAMKRGVARPMDRGLMAGRDRNAVQGPCDLIYRGIGVVAAIEERSLFEINDS